MSNSAMQRPAHETWHPIRRGYVIINMGGCVRHIPLWWHPKAWRELPSIIHNYRSMVRRMEEAPESDRFAKEFLRKMARGPVRTIPRDYDSLRAMGFYD